MTEAALTLLALVAAGLGQLAKSYKNLPTWIPQVVMGVLGLVFYAGHTGLPKPGASFDSWTYWVEVAVLAVGSLPGLASIIGLNPAMKTDVR